MPHTETRGRRRWARPSWSTVLIVLTAGLCVAALALRTELRSVLWARRIIGTTDPAGRARYLTALCRGGDRAHWGIRRLLTDERAEVRQYGVLALQHVHTKWSRANLLHCLDDHDASIRALAALGLAIHGDASVIPVLQETYRTGAENEAVAACLALQRMGGGAAGEALVALAPVRAASNARGALADALGFTSSAESGRALLELLSDHRPCSTPPFDEMIAEPIFDLARAKEPEAWLATTRASSRPAARTVAERAAASLNRLTGVAVDFSSDMSSEEQADAAAQWREAFRSAMTRP